MPQAPALRRVARRRQRLAAGATVAASAAAGSDTAAAGSVAVVSGGAVTAGAAGSWSGRGGHGRPHRRTGRRSRLGVRQPRRRISPRCGRWPTDGRRPNRRAVAPASDSSSISAASGCAAWSERSRTCSTLLSMALRRRPNSASWRARSPELRDSVEIWALASARSRMPRRDGIVDRERRQRSERHQRGFRAGKAEAQINARRRARRR